LEKIEENTIQNQLIRLIKLFIAIIVYGGDEIRRFLYLISGRELPGTCVVFCYHSVPDAFQQRFRRQLYLIHKTSKIIPADANIRLKAWRRYSIVTFDDGFRSVLKNALPVLKEWKIPATIFFATNYFGGFPVWIQEENHPDRNEKIMSSTEMKQLNSGIINIGSHTASHPLLNSLANPEITKELLQSKERLEELSRRSVSLFAIPFGKYPEEVFRIAREVGYSRVFTNDPERILDLTNKFVLGRFDVSPDTWNLEIRLILAGAYRWLPIAFRLKSKLHQWIHFRS